MPVRTLIADDDPVMRMLLGAIIEREASLELAGEAEDADEAIALAAREAPDVVLIDFDMPGGGVRAASEISAARPGVRVIAISAAESEAAREAMARAGATGWVPKGAPPEQLVSAILGR